MRLPGALSLLLCLAALSVPCTCNVFTSTAGIKSLFSLEKTTASLLQQYISTQEQTLQALRELASQLESTDIPPSDTLMRPSDSFGVINRLVSSLDKINKSIHSQERASLLELIDDKKTKRPTSVDLTGSAEGLLRLQRVYEQEPAALLPAATTSDLLLVGKTAYKQGDYESARVWLEAAFHNYNSSRGTDADTEELVDILDHLAFVSYKKGQVQEALDYSRRLLTVKPQHARVADNARFYEDSLKRDRNITSAQKGDAYFEQDNLLQHSERDMANFRKLCQGVTLGLPSPDAKCRLETFGMPQLLLKPIRVEHILTGRQEVMVFRGFASPAECQHIRDVATDKLKRAVAWTGGEFQEVNYRISTAAWLEPNADDVLKRIHLRMAQATQLNLTSAEQLQVSNYGLGGHYEPHYDHHGAKKNLPKTGDRLATFMMYLSNVEQGGFTAFPRLKVAVAPHLGDAVYWKNLKPGGVGDELTLHGGCPVLVGSKHVANKWIHEEGNICRPLPSARRSLEKHLLR